MGIVLQGVPYTYCFHEHFMANQPTSPPPPAPRLRPSDQVGPGKNLQPLENKFNGFTPTNHWKKILIPWKRNLNTQPQPEPGWRGVGGEGAAPPPQMHSQNMLPDSLAVHRIFGTRGPKHYTTTGPENHRTRGPEDHRTRGPEDQRTRGPQDQRTTGREDHRTRGPQDQRTKQPEDQRTKQPEDHRARGA